MQRDSEEDAWRAIVENYGDRPELDDEAAAEPPVARLPAGEIREIETDRAQEPAVDPAVDPDAHVDLGRADGERFVPPPPPPLPRLPPDRLVAWSGLFGSPTVLLVCLVFGIHLRPWLGYLLVAWFIGGFVYLVVNMPRGPGDPYDDGARL